VESAPRDGARAVVLSGTPGMFSAGLDVPLLLTLDRAAMATTWRDFYDLLGALACSPIPIAAAITGHAPAGGTVLTLFCDWRCTAQGNWKMGLNEVQVGLPLPPVIFAAAKRLVSARQAERLATGGLLVLPEEALRIGLVDEIVAPEQVIERTVEWCKGLLALPPGAMSATRARARADLSGLFDQSLQREIEEVTASWWSVETQSVLKAVAKKLTAKRSK
jgi:Delta3-Delta2-enoyl-CoA isomerase